MDFPLLNQLIKQSFSHNYMMRKIQIADLVEFQASSVEATPIAVPEVTSSGDATTGPYDNDNYILAKKQKVEVYGDG